MSSNNEGMWGCDCASVKCSEVEETWKEKGEGREEKELGLKKERQKACKFM